MTKEHQPQLCLLLNVTNVSHARPNVVVLVILGLALRVNDDQLDFLHAHLGLEVLVLKVKPIVHEEVSEANDAPPEDVLLYFVHLLCEFICKRTYTSTVEVAAIVILNEDLLLTLQLAWVHLQHLLVVIVLTHALLTNHVSL